MFECPVFWNVDFVKLLAPCLTDLALTELESLITNGHINILCHMTGLQRLSIRSLEPPRALLGGLMSLPESFCNLTNLHSLVRPYPF
jgi:hypothetical protein